MYQALYRKWRVRTFDDVLGQEHVTETLKRQNARGRLSHAYLFAGTRGTGKTSCAKILARAVNCENPQDGNPCNECASCRGIESGSIMDVTEMDAASNNGVDHIRALRDEAVYLPAAVKKRVYIVDEVHMLSTAAFNALLKILEEPPEHLLFILATTELHKVPATIRSRCQKFAFKRILPHFIEQRLAHVCKQEELEATEDALGLIASLSDGSMRDALSILDQCSGGGLIDSSYVRSCVGLTGSTEILSLMDDIGRSDGTAAVERLNEMYLAGTDTAAVLDQLCGLCRDILLVKLGASGSGGLLSGYFTGDEISEYAGKTERGTLLYRLDVLQKTLYEQDRSTDRKTSAELCLLKLCGFRALETVAAQIAEPSVQKVPAETSAAKKPEPAASAEKPKPGADWQTLLDALSQKLEPHIFFVINDTSHVDARIDGTTVKLTAKSPFSKEIVNQKDVKNAVQATATELFGTAFKVVVTDPSGGETAKKSKLDKLSRFENIVFE